MSPPKTMWTLRLIYATKTPVQLPGESSSSILHVDDWRWVVDTDIDRVRLQIWGRRPEGVTLRLP